MGINSEVLIKKCIGSGIGEFLVTDVDWNILYRTNTLSFDVKQWKKWALIYKTDLFEDSDWEIVDKESDRYYRARTFATEENGERYFVHHIYDVSDYAGLFRDLSVYSGEWRAMSECQRDIIDNLGGDCSDALPMVIRYLKTDRAVLFVERRKKIFRYSLQKDSAVLSETVNEMPAEETVGNRCTLPGYEEEEYICCCTGRTTFGVSYGLYIAPSENTDTSILPMYGNEFKLSIENSLMREQIVYENEHDYLTGLYNGGKLAEMVKTVFRGAKSLAVYNLDINYLKRTNDTYGHEFGSRLIIKGGKSLKAVERENLYGFRTGGDEFIMIAVDVDKDEADKILEDWKKELNRLNETDTEQECIMACGLCYAEAPFDLKEVLKKADERMYEDKRNIKIARGEDPDSR